MRFATRWALQIFSNRVLGMVFRGVSWLALILGAVAFDGKRCSSSVFHLVALAPRGPLPRPACGERSTAEAERRRSGEGGLHETNLGESPSPARCARDLSPQAAIVCTHLSCR